MAEDEKLRRARLLLERAEDMAGIGSWEADFATGKVSASHGARRIYGVEGELSIETMLAVPLAEYRPLLDRVRDEHIRLGKDYDVEFKIARVSDGAILDIHSRAAWDAENRILFGIIKDVTAEKKAQAEILELNRGLERRVAERTAELSEANDALSAALRDLAESQERQILAEKMATLGRLVASLAHELNTPLGAILSASDSEGRDAARFLDDLRSLRGFSDREFSAFGTIARCALNREPGPDHGAERARRKQYLAVLEARGIEEANLVAEELVDSGFSGCVDEVEAMAGEAAFTTLVHAAYRLSSVIRSNLIVSSAAQKAARVVGALKTYSHHGSAEVLRRGDIREQLETALILHHNRLKAGIEVVRLFREIPLVACYPDRLGQVWMNLIDNAVQSMGNSGHLIIETALETALDGDHVLVSVIDDGPGIAPEHHGEIFKPFFTTKSPGEGTGLGLDICRRLLEQIGATLSFESRPGRTEFVVRLKAVS